MGWYHALPAATQPFSVDEGASWKPVFEDADGKILSTQTARGFTGVVIGMYVQ
ncbi:MAG: hypothetical protein LBR97_00855 [Dysgonamonadaceae bacterium]|nr:hypothetical protein [Dysgonamonadaceae bacterium]